MTHVPDKMVYDISIRGIWISVYNSSIMTKIDIKVDFSESVKKMPKLTKFA